MASDDKAKPRRWPRWWRRAQVYARRANLEPYVWGISIFGFLAASLSAWLAVSDQAQKGQLLSGGMTASLLVGMLLPAMAILVLIGRWIAVRRGASIPGGKGRLHTQLVFLFSLIAAVPTLLVVIFASWLFQSGVEFWFSDNSRGLLENANKLARGYYEQTQRDVSNEAIAMTSDLRYILGQTSIVSLDFQRALSYQVLQRGLDEVAILQKGADGRMITVAIVDPARDDARVQVSPEDRRRVDGGEAIVVNAKADRIEAVTAIDQRTGLYLYAARTSDLLAISQGKRADNIVKAYQVLTQRARLLQLRFNIALFVISLVLVGLSVVFALRFADRQVQPLYDLVAAAQRVGAGNYEIRIAGRSGAEEIGLLNRAFNRMTEQIERQTAALVRANQQIDERRALMEAVLESVTAGVISLDASGAVRLMNSSAQKLLLGRSDGAPVGQALAEISPQIAGMVDEGKREGVVQHGVSSERGGDLRTLAVKLTANSSASGEAQGGHVITFEDITRQLLDQRQAAWSDVARRIAHEIKNPLTPIQLATERLSRRYRKQISDNPELFEELTATIIRQVGDLRKMVDEFSSFARIPKPVFRSEDPVDLARQSLFLQEVARSDIDFSIDAPGDIGLIGCDRHQFGQAMTNVLKNATEAVEAKQKQAGEDYRGAIRLSLIDEGESILAVVADNGIGLPQDRERIVEPYVTTREKGTGLGLAIVKKIVEEHGGDMNFASAEGGGSVVSLRFARDPLSAGKVMEPGE
ncbi:sensor histidine kinase [Novosphingobium sp. KACC 22771]|uniref:sensor histidine kinase n=1 Tax=Novosphingobium sp. KACC 22771 TaxID=3025670 RepID=UPI002365DB24|nr:ATP-binding protein [Novosphingobium sp. KACC 22771]WDF71206.1 ATP-binding protein [Novosphingobium sp. KACC 22771]